MLRQIIAGGDRFLGIYFAVMAALAWLTVLTGTYIIYPWYRAAPPLGQSVSALFRARSFCQIPQPVSGTRSEWSGKSTSRGSCPSPSPRPPLRISYARDLGHHPQLRSALLRIHRASLFAAGVAGVFGAMLDKSAPVEGGQTIHLVQGE